MTGTENEIVIDTQEAVIQKEYNFH